MAGLLGRVDIHIVVRAVVSNRVCFESANDIELISVDNAELNFCGIAGIVILDSMPETYCRCHGNHGKSSIFIHCLSWRSLWFE